MYIFLLLDKQSQKDHPIKSVTQGVSQRPSKKRKGEDFVMIRQAYILKLKIVPSEGTIRLGTKFMWPLPLLWKGLGT